MGSQNGNRSILIMSNKIEIDFRSTEYMESTQEFELPYNISHEDIKEVESYGLGIAWVTLDEQGSRLFIRGARQENLIKDDQWKTRDFDPHRSILTLRSFDNNFDFNQAEIIEHKDHPRIPDGVEVCLETAQIDLECYEIDSEINHWEGVE